MVLCMKMRACLVACRLILTASMLMRVCFRVLPRWPLTVRVCRVCLHLHVSQVMQAHRVQNLVFSSSATVYGDPQYLPIDEQHPVGGCTNPYGKTKYFIEEIIKDHCKAEKVGKEEKELVLHTTYCCSYSLLWSRTGMRFCCGTSTQSVPTPLAR